MSFPILGLSVSHLIQRSQDCVDLAVGSISMKQGLSLAHVKPTWLLSWPPPPWLCMPRGERVAGCGQRATPTLEGHGGPVRAAPVLPMHPQPTWISALNQVELRELQRLCTSCCGGWIRREAVMVAAVPSLALSSMESGTSLRVLGDALNGTFSFE